MTKFHIAQVTSVAMSLALVAMSWLATVTVPADAQFATASVAVELA